MRKLLSLAAGILFPLAMIGQHTPLSSVYDEFMGKPGYESQEIIPSKTSMGWEKDVSVDAIREVMEQISAIRIISTEGEGRASVKALWKSISNAAGQDGYITMMSVVSDDESVTMYGLKHDSGNMREFALAIKEKDEVTLITVSGNIDMSTLFSKDIMKDMMKIGENFKGDCEKEF